MGWQAVLKGERSRWQPRVTMSMATGGRNAAPVIRLTFREPPSWLCAGSMVEVLVGTDDDAGDLMVRPGTEHKVSAMPTPGKKPTGVVHLSIGPWLGVAFSFQRPVEVKHTVDGDALTLVLPPWARTGYQPTEAERTRPATRAAVAKAIAAAAVEKPKPPAPVDAVAQARRIVAGNPNIPIVMTWSEAVAAAASNGVTLSGVVQLGQWNMQRRRMGWPAVRISADTAPAAA